MEDKNVPILKTWLNYGLITAIGLIVVDIIFYLLDTPRESYLRFISILIFIGGIIWAAKSYRDLKSGGFISFGQSFTIGFLTGFFAAVIAAVYSYIFIAFVDPDIVVQALETAETRIIEQNPDITDQMLEQTMEMTEKFMTPGAMAVMSVIWNTVVVAVLSLVISFFIKKEDTPF